MPDATTAEPQQSPAQIALAQADRLGLVLHALVQAGEPTPAAVIVSGIRLFAFGCALAGIPFGPETLSEFLEGFPGVIPAQAAPVEAKPAIIVPTEDEVSAISG